MSVKTFEELKESARRTPGVKLLGIAGTKGAGKTTLWRGLSATLRSHERVGEVPCKRLRFSDTVAVALETIVGQYSPMSRVVEMSLDEQWAKQLPLGSGTVRTAMQKLGALIREINPDAIIHHYTAELYYLLSSYQDLYIITDDVRFPEEADVILRHGGTLIHLTRGAGGDSDPTEAGLKDYGRGFRIDNRDRTPEQTLEKAWEYLKDVWNIR